MTIHYHGTPITPQGQLARLYGEHFCVSYAHPQQADMCEAIGQSVLWDNGAFSSYTRGKSFDEQKLYEWIAPRLYHPHRAVVLDQIDGDVDAQREMTKRWPFPRDLSWPVWHLDKPLDYLSELSDEWPGVCLGSAGKFWEIHSTAWERRMEKVFDHLSRRGTLPWLHGLRMLGRVESWPLASADSTNLAQNYGRDPGCAYCKAKKINRVNHGRPKQIDCNDFFGTAE
jgi:hypothetical protein